MDMDNRDITNLSLIRDMLRSVEQNLNRRLDEQDQTLRDIKVQTRETNGRVTKLEGARERAQGTIYAFRWIPHIIMTLMSGGIGSLLVVLLGGPHK